MLMTPLRTAAVATLGLIIGCAVAPAAVAATATTNVLPVNVTIVMPLAVPESMTGLIPAETLEEYTSPTGVLTRELNAVINTPAAIGIDPRILVSIRVLGTDAPASATEWLAALESASNDTFALGYADSDITAALQSGSGGVIQPESFDFAIDPSRFEQEPETSATATPGVTATSSPTQTATPADPDAAPGQPTTESLLAWDYTLDNVAWPAANTVTTADLAALAGGGYTTTILDSGNVTSSARALSTIGGNTTLVADGTSSDLLRPAVTAGLTENWQSAVGTLTAHIASLPDAGTQPASVLMTVDRVALKSGSHLRATILALSASPEVRFTTLGELAAGQPAQASLVEEPQAAAHLATVASLRAAEAGDASFASIAENPSLITAERRVDLLAVLSVAWNDSPSGWQQAATGYLDASTNLRASVGIVESSAINLWADRASLPIIIGNTLDQPVTIYITVRPLTPLLAVEKSSVELTIAPDSQRKGAIPVQSLSNGTVELAVTVRGATGVQIGSTTFVKTNVQAGWETPTTIALAVVVLLIFAAGIYRTIRRRRRTKPADATTGDEAGAADLPGAATADPREAQE